MIEVFKEEMSKFFKDVYGRKRKPVEVSEKENQWQKLEIASVKKTQTEGKQEMKT